MKKVLLILLLVTLALVGTACKEKVKDDKNPITLSPVVKTGDLGAFSAETPVAEAVFTDIPTFSWTPSSNAEFYTLEICTNDDFKFDEKGVYIVKTGIQSTEFSLAANLKKNTTYFWRVTAENADDWRVFDEECLTFRYNAKEERSIDISVGYADEWKVHEAGSKATVSLETGFFEEGEKAIRVYYEREDTQRGEEFVEANGWVVVTRSLESEFYGLDAFKFNFYYMGNDARAFFRVIDVDNEYWYAPIQIAKNAKQTVIIRRDDFVLRTQDTPVVNETFDSYYLKNMELVFERVDGDGVAYFGGLSAIRFEDIADQFVEQVDFTRFTENPRVDGLYFDFDEIKAEEGGAALTYTFSVDEEVATRIKNHELSSNYDGNGFFALTVEKVLTGGNAFVMNVDTSGMNGKSFNFIFRVVEEDGDVWSFLIRSTSIPTDGKLVIPFLAFNINEAKGDGAKQFYYVKEFRFGMSDCYSGGTITVRNMAVSELATEVKDLYTINVEDGLIDDFDSYQTNLDLYYVWEPSTVNKDEKMELVKENALGIGNKAVKFYYKTDLTEASYKTRLTSPLIQNGNPVIQDGKPVLKDFVTGFNAITVRAKDHSSKDTFNGDLLVCLVTNDGTTYVAVVSDVANEWTDYVIPFSAFAALDDKGQLDPSVKLFASDKIVECALAFRCYLTGVSENNMYQTGSNIAVDRLAFTDTEATEIVRTKIVLTESMLRVVYNTSAQTALVDTFEDECLWYVNESAIDSSSRNPNSAVTFEPSAGGREDASVMKLKYKTQMASPYAVELSVDSAVQAKGLVFDMLGDSRTSTKLEVVLYADAKAYIATVTVEQGWNTYSVGFDNFTTKGGSAETFSAQNVSSITRLGLIIKNNNGSYNYYSGDVYLDEIRFDNTIAVSVNTCVAD